MSRPDAKPPFRVVWFHVWVLVHATFFATLAVLYMLASKAPPPPPADPYVEQAKSLHLGEYGEDRILFLAP